MPTPVMFVFGPSGGTGGGEGTENESDVSLINALFTGPNPPPKARVERVDIRAGDIVDAIQFSLERSDNALSVPLAQHGGPGGYTEVVLSLKREEHITAISGKYGKYGGEGPFVTFITIKTDGPEPQTATAGIGGSEEADYTYVAPPGFEIIGFYGRSGDYVDALGVVMREIQP